jgi:hypothetical protein
MTQHHATSEVVESSNTPNYTAVEISTKDPTEYNYVERRAELLQQIRDLGHPAMVNQTEMAERYGVSQQQISKDLDRLAEHINASLGARRDLITEAVIHRSIRGLLEEEEYRQAARTVLEWNDWLDDRQHLAELADRLTQLENQYDFHQ